MYSVAEITISLVIKDYPVDLANYSDCINELLFYLSSGKRINLCKYFLG